MNAELKLQRRVFFKALAIGLAVPAALHASKMAIAAPTRPQRLMFVYMPHGAPAEHQNPAGKGADFSLLGNGEQVWGALEPYKKNVLYLKHTEIKNSTNHAASRYTLTDVGSGVSIDHVIAKARGTQVLAMGSRVFENGSPSTNTQFSNDGTDWIRPIQDPVRLYDDLFGAVAAAPSAGPSDADFRKEALALTRKQVADLKAGVTGLTKVESKLQTHLDALDALASGSSSSPIPPDSSCAKAPVIEGLDKIRAEAAAFDKDRPTFRYVDQDANYGPVTTAMYDLAGHAMLCSDNRVLFFQNMFTNANISFGHIGLAKEHHLGLSHAFDAGGRAEFAKAQKWLISQLARTVEILNVPDPFDPDHSALENSLIYVFSEIADGQDHQSTTIAQWVNGKPQLQWLPSAIIGGGWGKLKTGQYLEFDPEADAKIAKTQQTGIPGSYKCRPHADVLLTIAQLAGASIDKFGTTGTTPVKEMVL